jgi:hypothetical protein
MVLEKYFVRLERLEKFAGDRHRYYLPGDGKLSIRRDDDERANLAIAPLQVGNFRAND